MKDRLKQLQETYKMSQQDFARAMGITSGALSNIYSERSRPTANHVSGVHLAFPEVSVNWLMFGEGEMFVGKSPVSNEQEVASRQTEVASRRAMVGGAEPQERSVEGSVEFAGSQVGSVGSQVKFAGHPVAENSEAVAEAPDRFSGNGAAAETNMRGESAQRGSRDDERYSDDEPLVNFAFDKKRGDVVVQPGLFDVDVEGAAGSPVSSALAPGNSSAVSVGAKSGGVGAKSSGIGVKPMREITTIEAARMMSSQPAVTSPQSAVTSPQSAVAQAPNESEICARNFDTTARRISEIKVFYDDGTYETFLPSRR